MSRSEKLTFTGGSGAQLSARLDLPEDEPRAWAIFAHCFSCSKDVIAAARISSALCERGIAVLRFDFTGLGNSDGDFANTNFSSNVDDLIAAADYLRDHHQAPELLIGHSLGGAAVLMASSHMSEVKAVATIGAPADVEHVKEAFRGQIDEIEAEGEAKVSLAGRPFVIKKQFLDDLKTHQVTDAVREMRKALLILHSPLDEVVSIDHASDLFIHAKHPKSFVTLDDADHLLTCRRDAEYAAHVIAAWAERYVDLDASTPDRLSNPPAKTVVVEEAGQGYDARMASGRHRFMGDQPAPIGKDLGPSPYDLIALALGLCTTQTLRMYAGKKKLDIAPVRVAVAYEKRHVEDCEGCVEGKGMNQLHLTREITLPDGLAEDVRTRLLEIADRCPVHRTLAHHHAVIETSLAR